jgi:hypothetical protein
MATVTGQLVMAILAAILVMLFGLWILPFPRFLG